MAKLLKFTLLVIFGFTAHAETWQPSAGHTQIPLWENKVPDVQALPGPENIKVSKTFFSGKHTTAVMNVSEPTLTLYPPKKNNTGVTVVVFPGGGFELLAMDLEGTEVCDWLTSKGINCVLLKYRVPSLPYDWHTKRRPNNLMISTQALEDAQRAMGLVRSHAKEWHLDANKIGVLGFSAGGYLVAEISTHFDQRLYEISDDADKESCRPDFAVAIYPGHLSLKDKNYGLNPNILVTSKTPTTFLLQAEDDDVDGVKQSLVYYIALKNAGVPAELHLYAQGKHAFGLRDNDLPITHWPDLVDTWLHTIGVLTK